MLDTVEAVLAAWIWAVGKLWGKYKWHPFYSLGSLGPTHITATFSCRKKPPDTYVLKGALKSSVVSKHKKWHKILITSVFLLKKNQTWEQSRICLKWRSVKAKFEPHLSLFQFIYFHGTTDGHVTSQVVSSAKERWRSSSNTKKLFCNTATLQLRERQEELLPQHRAQQWPQHQLLQLPHLPYTGVCCSYTKTNHSLCHGANSSSGSKR